MYSDWLNFVLNLFEFEDFFKSYYSVKVVEGLQPHRSGAQINRGGAKVEAARGTHIGGKITK